MGRLRASLVDLIGGVPGGIRRATDLGKTLGLDAKTSWRVFKIATSSNPVEVSAHVPSRTSMNRVIREASRRGASARAVGAVQQALGQFDELVRRFAGDRMTFDSMASALAGEGSSQVDQMHYRAAFRANSHILGVQARVQFSCVILHPNAADPLLMDTASIRGHHDLRRLRRDASIALSRMIFRHDSGGPAISQPEPLDPSCPDATGYLSEFCGDASPPLRVVHRSEGDIRVELVGETVGLPSSGTYLFGHAMRRAMAIHRTPDDSHLWTRTSVRMPTELLVCDTLVHRGMFGPLDPRAFLMSDVDRDVRVTDPRKWKPLWLPNPPTADCLGRGVAAAHSLELPRHVELLGWALRRLGWDPDEFDVYRCRVEYPVLHSCVVFEVPLPELGGTAVLSRST